MTNRRRETLRARRVMNRKLTLRLVRLGIRSIGESDLKKSGHQSGPDRETSADSVSIINSTYRQFQSIHPSIPNSTVKMSHSFRIRRCRPSRFIRANYQFKPRSSNFLSSVVVAASSGFFPSLFSIGAGAAADSDVAAAGAVGAAPWVARCPANRCFCKFIAKINKVRMKRTLFLSLALSSHD